MSWKCDKCGYIFELDDIPEDCPECGEDEGTFSLIDTKE